MNLQKCQGVRSFLVQISLHSDFIKWFSTASIFPFIFLLITEELERVFTWLGLDVRTYTDLTSQEIKELMRTWQCWQDHKDSDCFICCILSHGESGAIYGKDEELVSIRMIMSHFTAKQCPQLAEKPKLFFIQACQGKDIQCPVYVEADAQIPDLSSMQQNISPSESIPEEADFLLGMATIDGYVSFRHVQQGTWYIQALCSKLQLLVPRYVLCVALPQKNGRHFPPFFFLQRQIHIVTLTHVLRWTKLN